MQLPYLYYPHRVVSWMTTFWLKWKLCLISENDITDFRINKRIFHHNFKHRAFTAYHSLRLDSNFLQIFRIFCIIGFFFVQGCVRMPECMYAIVCLFNYLSCLSCPLMLCIQILRGSKNVQFIIVQFFRFHTSLIFCFLD